MINLLKNGITLLGNLKTNKVHYLLVIVITAILITDSPLRDSLLHMINIGTHSRQLKTAVAIEELDAKMSGLIEYRQKTDKMLNDMQVFQWQSIITNETLPTVLRLQAYDAYTESGHNSWVHDYYEAELKPLNNKSMKYQLHGE